MTPFNDDDLKWLKEIISVNVHAQINESIFDHEFLQNLLARLEAAEIICQQVEIYITKATPKMFRTKELLKTWQKAAGK